MRSSSSVSVSLPEGKLIEGFEYETTEIVDIQKKKKKNVNKLFIFFRFDFFEFVNFNKNKKKNC